MYSHIATALLVVAGAGLGLNIFALNLSLLLRVAGKALCVVPV
ncbi:MAG: hypothetical protein AB7G75_13800 [Candidatus Binatia bacterium]